MVSRTLTPKGYRARVIDEEISKLMESHKILCIEGPKWCGKTWTSRNHSVSEFNLNDPRGGYANLNLVRADPLVAFNGAEPHLIDEWQECPAVWDAGKYLVDESERVGRFIVTGSSTPLVKGVRHDGTGRYGMVRMRPMSLYESGDSDGSVSLNGLFDHGIKAIGGEATPIGKLIDLTVRGGWPGLIGKGIDVSMKYCRDYVDSTVRTASILDGKIRNQTKMRMLIKSLARNESTLASISKISADIAEDIPESKSLEDERTTLSIQTIPDYMDALNRVFFIEDQPPFTMEGRSKVRLNKSSKRHLADPSLSIAALGLDPAALFEDLRTFGFMFEALCIRDLRVYAQANGWGSVYHYRDDRGVEVDAIVRLNGGRYAAFEIKVGDYQADEGAKSLCKFRDRMEDSGARLPEFLCVLTGTGGAAYRRDDGVYVVPITQLKH